MVLSDVSCELNKVLAMGQILCVHSLLMIILKMPPNPMHTRITSIIIHYNIYDDSNTWLKQHYLIFIRQSALVNIVTL